GMQQILRGARVVDGTGAPSAAADVGIDDGRIVATSDLGPTAEVIDLDGLVLAPGFIDIHTHYDAQVLWDPDLTPSSWHGVTSVVMGNCGFGVAPTRPEHRDTVIRTLENVEGVAAEALALGIDWCFETFPEYLAALDRRPKRINVGAFIGHTPLRLSVLHGEERAATPEETARMQEIVHEALVAGALGFATSRQPAHQGAFGRPVPSRFAELDEISALASVLGATGTGVLQASIGPGLFIDQLSEMSEENGIPVTWTALVARSDNPGAALRLIDRAAALPGEVYPQIACRPIVMQMSMADPIALAEIDVSKEVLALPRSDRAGLYTDPAWRARARPVTMEAWAHRWHRSSVDETGVHAAVRDVPLDQLAADRGTTAFDLMIDLALADGMATRFRIILENDGEDEIGDLLADTRAILGLSDAGAHASQLCDACYATYLLSHWVRDRKALSLEDAVWRLTGHAHQAFRIAERGLVREGFLADLVAFDPD